MKAILSNIKENLFDAPESVKKSFNEIVRYFSENNEFETYGLIERERLIGGKGRILPRFVHDKKFKKGNDQAAKEWKNEWEKKFGHPLVLLKQDSKGKWKVTE
jgi:hypothetical protein